MIAVIGLSVGVKLEADKVHGGTTPTISPTPSPSPTPTPSPSLCTSRECVELGNQVLSQLDTSIDPCDNFYKFACNRFLKEAIIPYGEWCFKPSVLIVDIHIPSILGTPETKL